MATLTEELIAAKLLIAEKEEIIERLRRAPPIATPKIEEDATADELRALLASERAHHKKQLDDAHARLAEVVPLPMSPPDSTRDLSTPRFSPEKQKGKMFSGAVRKASTLKQRARDAYKARRKVAAVCGAKHCERAALRFTINGGKNGPRRPVHSGRI